MDKSSGVGARGVAACDVESAKSSRTETIAVKAARAARTSVMWKERAAKEAVMEFAQQRILYDQKRRRQQDERRRREKVSPRPFASGRCPSMRFRAVCTAAECAGGAHACARAQGKARKEVSVIASPEVCGIGLDA